jgi:uncharacterized membrane protein
MVDVKRTWPHLSGTLIISSLVSIGLFLEGAFRNHSFGYWYMVWNLLLAWLPLLFVWLLVRMMKRKPWSSWEGIGLSVLWLGFLPNSFYMVSDYIHLQDVPTVDVLYDAVMFTSFICTSLILGYMSLYLFHVELRKRLSAWSSMWFIAGVLLLCSFAIYLGRDLRWNTWDLFVNPAGILFDVSDRFINPRAHPQTFLTIFVFFALLSSLYLVIWNIIHTLRPSHRR